MNTWVFPTVSEVFMGCEPELDWLPESQGNEGEREWHAAIATILSLLLMPQATEHSSNDSLSIPDSRSHQGLILTGPSPLLSDLGLFSSFHTWALTPAHGNALRLLPCEHSHLDQLATSAQNIPLLPADPLAAERFCLVQTASFCWIAVLRQLPGQGVKFQFSFVPDTVQQVLQKVRSRIQLTRPHQLKSFDDLLQQWPVVEPDYRLTLQFSRQLIQNYRQVSAALPALTKPSPLDPSNPISAQSQVCQAATVVAATQGQDIDLLKALAHEVRTPLSTIQTFTQLLLKRSDLPTEVLKRLESIRRECHDQIERFSLIFRAMELATSETQPTVQLTSISVQEVLQTNISRWQKQADRRNLSFHMEVPQQLPAIAISDPTMLEQALTGLIEQLSHRLPMGSQMQLQIALAGDQLKLELRSDQTITQSKSKATMPMLKAIGDLLMLQPETGGLSLSLPVTKHLFEILGGKLTVRQHQQQGEVLTIFLPLGTDSTAY